MKSNQLFLIRVVRQQTMHHRRRQVVFCLGLLAVIGFVSNNDFAEFVWRHAADLSEDELQRLRDLKNGVAGKDRWNTTIRDTDGDNAARNTVYIGVLTAEKFLRTRADACLNTWVSRLPPKDVEFFCQVQNESDWKEWKGNIVQLEGLEDVYPPLEKLFRMFQHICSHHLHNYDWFMRADDDTYIKPDKLVNFLATLDKDKVIYLGQIGHGVENDRHLLGLEGHGYCLGGPGFLLSRPAMLGLCPHLGECLKNAVSHHDDVELGRCVTRHLGVECASRHRYTIFVHNTKKKSWSFPSALTLHPVKEPRLMYKIHFSQQFVN